MRRSLVAVSVAAQGCDLVAFGNVQSDSTRGRKGTGLAALALMIARAGPCKTGGMSSPLNCLVTGATGYIGGRLVPELLSAGYAVRCMARDPGKLSDRPWSDDVEIAVADVMDDSAVRRALRGVDVAYYLIHSLGTDEFEQ